MLLFKETLALNHSEMIQGLGCSKVYDKEPHKELSFTWLEFPNNFKNLLARYVMEKFSTSRKWAHLSKKFFGWRGWGLSCTSSVASLDGVGFTFLWRGSVPSLTSLAWLLGCPERDFVSPFVVEEPGTGWNKNKSFRRNGYTSSLTQYVVTGLLIKYVWFQLDFS